MIKTTHNLTIKRQSERYIRSAEDIMQVFYPIESFTIRLKRKAAAKIYQAIKDGPNNKLSDFEHLTNEYITKGLLWTVRKEMINLGLIELTDENKLTFSYGFLNNLRRIDGAIDSFMKPDIESDKRKAMKMRRKLSLEAIEKKEQIK